MVTHLVALGYKVLFKNWRTRRCEIDIVASKGKCVYFVEVKYRQQATQGSGFDYITAKKLKQMRFGAEMWVSEYRWTGDYCLAAAEVSGTDFLVTGFETGFL